MNKSALNVIQDERLLGELVVDNGHWQFTYNDLWLRAEIFSPSLSPELVKRKAPYVDSSSDRSVQNFFENMLPDGSMREIVSEVRGHGDSFELLTSMGHDLPGSLSLEPQMKTPATKGVPKRLSVGEFPDMDKFTNLVASAGIAPGAEMKLSADMNGTVLTTLAAKQASRVIIKAGGKNADGSISVINEWYCTRLASSIGFDINHFEVSRLFGGSMIIKRFDRMRKGSKISRLPVINGCQALGISQKLSSEQLTTQSLLKLSKLTENPGKTIRRLFSWVCYNAIIGNGDVELNDLSFSLAVDQSRATKLKLLPVYDLSSSLAATSLKPKAALFRGTDLKSITFEQLLEIGSEMGFDDEQAYVELEAILHGTRGALQSIEGDLDREINQLPSYEGIRLGEAEFSYMRDIGRNIESQIDRLVA